MRLTCRALPFDHPEWTLAADVTDFGVFVVNSDHSSPWSMNGADEWSRSHGPDQPVALVIVEWGVGAYVSKLSRLSKYPVRAPRLRTISSRIKRDIVVLLPFGFDCYFNTIVFNVSNRLISLDVRYSISAPAKLRMVRTVCAQTAKSDILGGGLERHFRLNPIRRRPQE